jgi:hypothetical protein
MGATFDDIKRAYGPEQLRELAEAEGMVRRGSGQNRSECPGCRNGDARGASIGERGGVGVWNCHRDERHRGSAIDFLALARGLSVAEAAAELERRAGVVSFREPPRPRTASVPKRPPTGEVAEVWARAKPLLDIPDVAQAWRERGVDPAAVEDRDLARALPTGVAMPRWAYGAGTRWSDGLHRLLIPLFDASGHLTSLHARAATAPTGIAKGLSPLGFEVGGLVFADPLARLMLMGQSNDVLTWLLIAEGGPDFLTAASRYSDADESAPAVLGVIAGSWTPTIANRVPSGSRVLLAVHGDPTGDKYASTIASSLSVRCQVRRLDHPKEVA